MSNIINFISNFNNIHQSDRIFNGDALQHYTCERNNAPRCRTISKIAARLIGSFSMALIQGPRAAIHLGLGVSKTGPDS